MSDLTRLLGSISAPALDGEAAARHHLDSLTKPPGSLGRLEEIALRLAILRGRAPAVTQSRVPALIRSRGRPACE